MPDFNEHLNQAKRNLKFLEIANQPGNYFDWQVTVCFYSALHVINAHLAHCNNSHYRTHIQVDEAINPFNQFSSSKLDSETYTAYSSLMKLSRRSRYLVNENLENHSPNVHFTHEKHLKKALIHLDKVLHFFSNRYRATFDELTIKYPSELDPKRLLVISKSGI